MQYLMQKHANLLNHNHREASVIHSILLNMNFVLMPYKTDMTMTMAVVKQHVVEYKQLVFHYVARFFCHSLFFFSNKNVCCTQ